MSIGAENEQAPDVAKTGLRVLGTGGIFVVHTRLSRAIDKRLLRNFLDLCKVYPIIPVWRNIAISPADTILAFIPDAVKTVDRKQLQIIQMAKEGILQARLQGLQKDLLFVRTEVTSWISRLNEISTETEPDINDNSAEFLRLGLRLARKTQDTIVQMFQFHSILLRPISKSTLILLGELLEVLMVQRSALGKHSLFVCQLAERVGCVIASRIQVNTSMQHILSFVAESGYSQNLM